jgi:short-subunit dehydrogenase
MKALITGASSGMGRDMARYLASKNIDLILVARRKERLEELKGELKVNVKIITLDLSDEKNVYKLYDECKKDNIDILINNAGFGLFGDFIETDLDKELEMINVNAKTPHILTKLFLKDFVKRNSGYILNVCSSAGFMAGPRLNTYYATKNYILKLSMAINEELRHMKSNVSISCLCPGPVDTEFNKVANGSFKVKALSSQYVSRYAIDKMFKKKMLIIPGFGMKLGIFGIRFLPYRLQLKFTYNIQSKKMDK